MRNVIALGTQKALNKCYYYLLHHHYPKAPAAKVPEVSLNQNAMWLQYLYLYQIDYASDSWI